LTIAALHFAAFVASLVEVGINARVAAQSRRRPLDLRPMSVASLNGSPIGA
jgi:hypothetical protein